MYDGTLSYISIIFFYLMMGYICLCHLDLPILLIIPHILGSHLYSLPHQYYCMHLLDIFSYLHILGNQFYTCSFCYRCWLPMYDGTLSYISIIFFYLMMG